jgi:hypothetical protein
MLPCWLSGYAADWAGARWLTLMIEKGQTAYSSMLAQLPHASAALGRLPSEKIVNKYRYSVNWNIWRPEEQKIAGYLVRLNLLYAWYRLKIMKETPIKFWPAQILQSCKDAAMGALVLLLFGGRSIVRSSLVQKQLQMKNRLCHWKRKNWCSLSTEYAESYEEAPQLEERSKTQMM